MMDRAGELETLLRDLVAVDSTSRRPNGPVLDVLEPLLSARGFHCRRLRYTDDEGVPKENLVALPRRLGPSFEDPVELALVGHTDCVPFDPAWERALTLTHESGRLYGRGACDTKAFIACAVVAAGRVGAADLPRPVALLFTADEEVGCTGAKQLVEAGVGRARFAIVGEPTSLRPVRAHKGYCLAEVEVLGREGHSAYPDVGVSAIFRAARYLRRLEQVSLGPLRQEHDAAFEPPFTTVNVGLISGGKAKNVIPGSCRFTVEWRPIPSQPVEQGARLLQELAEALAREEPGFEARVRVLRADAGVDTSEGSELVRFLCAESGRPPATVSFGTEAPQLTQLGAQAVVFGPGDIQVAHRTGEFVPVDELLACEAILERALVHFGSGTQLPTGRS